MKGAIPRIILAFNSRLENNFPSYLGKENASGTVRACRRGSDESPFFLFPFARLMSVRVERFATFPSLYSVVSHRPGNMHIIKVKIKPNSKTSDWEKQLSLQV